MVEKIRFFLKEICIILCVSSKHRGTIRNVSPVCKLFLHKGLANLHITLVLIYVLLK